jgi:hypothetical protein
MADKDDKDPKDPPKDPKDDSKLKEITLTQEKLEELMGKAFARGAKNSKEAKEVESMEKELVELRGMKTWLEAEAAAQQKKGKGADDPDAKAEYQKKLADIKAGYEERVKTLEAAQRAKETSLSAKVEGMRLAGLKGDVVTPISGIAANPEEVFTLMNARGCFKWDDESERYVCVDPVKKTVLLDVDADGEPLAPGKYGVQWLDQNPRHKRSSGRTGSGQGSGDDAGGEGPSSGIDTKDMKPSEVFARRHEIVADLRQRR